MSQEINLGQIKQEGAGINNVISWNGTRWVPTDPPSGADGNGIYTGSGDIGQGIASTTTRAKIPDEGIFRIDYFDSSYALQITDIEGDAGDIYLKSNDGTVLFGLDGSGKFVGAEIDSSTGLFDIKSAGTLIRNSGGGLGSGISSDEKAILELRSTTKGFLLPRMSTTQFNAFSAGSGGVTADGMMVYETGVDKIKLRANNAWVDIGGPDGNGIYSGSGTIPNATAATLVDGGTFRINYFGGVAAFYTDELETFIQSSNINRRVTANTTSVILSSDTSTATLSGTNLTVNKQTYISTTGGSPDVNSILDLSSADKYLYLPRVITGNLSGTANNGAIVYDSTANVFKGRQGGAWITFANAAPGNGGIYGGSGNIPNNTVATVANGGNFTIDYFNATDAIRIDDPSNSITFKSRNGTNIAYIDNAEISLKINGSGVNISPVGTVIDLPVNLARRVTVSNEFSPAALAVDTNNWNPAIGDTSSHWLINSNLNVNVTGIVPNDNSRLIYLHNIGNFNITLKKESTNSAVGNRFGFPNDIVLTPGAGITLLHSSSAGTNRWKCLGTSGINVGTGGIYGGSGTIAPGATATVSAGSFFKLEYADGSDALILDASSGMELRGETSTYGFVNINQDNVVIGAGGGGGPEFKINDEIVEVNQSWLEAKKRVQFSGVQSPAQLNGNENNYNTQNVAFLRLSSSVQNVEITGLQHGKGDGNFNLAGGRILYVTNRGAVNTIRFMGENANSIAENRIISTRALTPGETQGLYYDKDSQRWRWLNGA